MRCQPALGLQEKLRILVVCTAFLWHYSLLGLARIHVHRRTQSRIEWLHEADIILVRLAHSDGLV